MNIKQAVTNPLSSIMAAGKRVFEPQPSSISELDLLDALNSFQGVSFDQLSDFFRYYKEEYFRTAYTQLDPFSCHQLAISNPWIASAVNAIVKSIASADIVAKPKDQDNPNELEIEYVEELLGNPNDIQTDLTFMKLISLDLLQTGRAYIEVAYNDYGFPCALYRVAPYKIKPVRYNGNVYYIRSNGYIFPENTLIPIFNPNPFTDYDGLSPLVALFTKIMLDEAVTEHNLRYFVNDVLKGLLSFSDKVGYDDAMKEVKRIQKQVVDMRENGQAGHLVTYGATFQALTNNSMDSVTPDIQQKIIDAIKAVFHVPPSKMAIDESGNIGSGTGESQDQMMNETLNDWASLILSYLNNKLLSFMGITDTTLEFTNLTKTDDLHQAQLDTENLNNGTTDINEVRNKRGDEPYEDDIANEPLIDYRKIPLSFIAKLDASGVSKPVDPNAASKGGPSSPSQPNNPPPNVNTPDGNLSQIMQKVETVLGDRKLKGTYIVREFKKEEIEA
jgi:HK97 family phage portal protein